LFVVEPCAAKEFALLGAAMLDHLKANNRAWAERMVTADASFFKRLERQQSPKYLWIGCSDSRVPANEIVGPTPASFSCTGMSPT
jgi:carbonic anhydrase